MGKKINTILEKLLKKIKRFNNNNRYEKYGSDGWGIRDFENGYWSACEEIEDLIIKLLKNKNL